MRPTFMLTAAALLTPSGTLAWNDYEKTVKDGFAANAFKPSKAEVTGACVAQLRAPA